MDKEHPMISQADLIIGPDNAANANLLLTTKE